jgi:hypothetical protein
MGASEHMKLAAHRGMKKHSKEYNPIFNESLELFHDNLIN